LTAFAVNLSFALVAYDTRRVELSEAPELPLCPWCNAPLESILWHKVREGPPVSYLIALSCGRCGAVLDCLAAGAAAAAVIVAG